MQVVVNQNSWRPNVISVVLIIVDAVVTLLIRPIIIMSRHLCCAWMNGEIYWASVSWAIGAMNGEIWAIPVDAVQTIAFSHDFDRLAWIFLRGVELFIFLICAWMHWNEVPKVCPVILSVDLVSPELYIATVVFDRIAEPALDSDGHHETRLRHVKCFVLENANFMLLVYHWIPMLNHMLKLHSSVDEYDYSAYEREASSNLRLCLLFVINMRSWPLLSKNVNPSEQRWLLLRSWHRFLF